MEEIYSHRLQVLEQELPYAIKGLSKAVPTLATGAVSALGSLGIDKIFGKGIDIPKKYFPMLPYIVNELTKSQIDQINKVSQTGGRLFVRTNKKTSRRRIFGYSCLNWNSNGN